MASSSKKSKKSGADKPRISATQRKLRRHQVGMAIFAMILVGVCITENFGLGWQPWLLPGVSISFSGVNVGGSLS